MMRIQTLLRRAATVAVCIVMTACASEPEPVYYLLDQQSAQGSTSAPSVSGGPLIGLREIGLPLYARRTQIAAIGPDGAVSLSELNRWAEDLPRASSRVVARTLSEMTGRESVIEPWGPDLKIGHRVDIEVDYFVGALGGVLRLEGQYRVIPASGASTAGTFAIEETSTGPGYDALVQSHTRALGKLAREIVETLQ
jgi:uncharacterized lipoprotein YmbA